MKLLHEHPFEDTEKLLKTGIFVSFLIFVLELFGGFWSNSLALHSDAWHQFFDSWALIISFFAVWFARRPANDRRTYGLHRMEVMAALINGFTVFFIAMGILYAAVKRYQNPQAIEGKAVLIIGGISLGLNIIVAALFYRKSEHDLNLRGVFLHLVGDALSTVAVLVAGGVVMLTGWRQVDPIVSGLIAVIILWGSGRLLRDSFNTLLEAVPHGIEAKTVGEEIQKVGGVLSVHDLHIWSICSHIKALSGHVLVSPESMGRQDQILNSINQSLKEHFGISHTTIQVESKAWPGIEQVQC